MIEHEWQEQVIEERKALDARIHRLEDFLKSPVHARLPDTEKGLLFRQELYMRAYLSMLDKRIERWNHDTRSVQSETS